MPVLMEIDGIRSPGVISAYEGWMLLNTFSWGGSRGSHKPTDRGLRVGAFVVAPQLKAVTVSRSADIMTPIIWQLMLTYTKKPVKFAWLRTGSDGLTPYLELTLSNALITSMGENASFGGPNETITWTYDEVELRVVNVGDNLSGAQDVVRYTLPQAARG
jgi:type VI protein secretion system component Hcp